MFYCEISLIPAICCFLYVQGAYLHQKRATWAHTTTLKQKLTLTWVPLFAGGNDVAGRLYTRLDLQPIHIALLVGLLTAVAAPSCNAL